MGAERNYIIHNYAHGYQGLEKELQNERAPWILLLIQVYFINCGNVDISLTAFDSS